MTNGKKAVALAVRVHAPAGTPTGDGQSVDALRSAAAGLGREMPGVAGGPSRMTHDGTLLLHLSSPGGILGVVRSMADALRPRLTTFCVAIAEQGAGRESGDGAAQASLDGTIVTGETVASAALRGIEETDVRECRVRVLRPVPDALLGSLVDLILVAYDEMTERQRQIVGLVRSSETQQQVADHLDISRQAVNQSLASAGWPHLRHAELTVETFLSDGAYGPPGSES